MTEQHGEDSQAALVPRPAATPEALRRAISGITPSRLKEVDRQLVEASTEAQELQKIGPLRTSCHRWSRHVEIQRYPATARHLAEMEHIVDTGYADTAYAAKEFSRILRDVDAALSE